MTYSMSTAAARKASKKTQHVRSAGDWITLILLVAGALLVLFPLLVLTVNAFKTSADYNATGPLSLPKHFTMEGIISFWTTTNFPLKFWNSFIISLVVAVAAVVLSVLNSFALGIGKVKGNTWIVLGIMLANMMPQEALLYPLYTMFKQVGLYNTKLAIIIIFTINARTRTLALPVSSPRTTYIIPIPASASAMFCALIITQRALPAWLVAVGVAA